MATAKKKPKADPAGVLSLTCDRLDRSLAGREPDGTEHDRKAVAAVLAMGSQAGWDVVSVGDDRPDDTVAISGLPGGVVFAYARRTVPAEGERVEMALAWRAAGKGKARGLLSPVLGLRFCTRAGNRYVERWTREYNITQEEAAVLLKRAPDRALAVFALLAEMELGWGFEATTATFTDLCWIVMTTTQRADALDLGMITGVFDRMRAEQAAGKKTRKKAVVA